MTITSVVVRLDGSPASDAAPVRALEERRRRGVPVRDPARGGTGHRPTPPAAARVVVGVDGAGNSLRALRFAHETAARRGAKLRVVHAWALPYMGFAGSAAIPQAAIDELVDQAAKTLREAVHRAAIDVTRAPVEAQLVQGPPVPALLEAARDADLLVVGSRGHGRWKGLLTGSVSQQCVARATSPVAVVRDDGERGTDARPERVRTKDPPTNRARSAREGAVMKTQADNVKSRGTASMSMGDRDGGYAVERRVDEVLRRRMWFTPGQVRVRMHDGTAVLTGDVGRRSTADIAARLASTVPGVDGVDDRIRFRFDDADLVRSRVGRTHPFSAEPFPPGSRRRR